MSNFVLVEQHSLTMIEVTAADRHTYSLDDAARLADVHPDLLLHYCRVGLLGDHRVQGDAGLR